jgi:uncharacterized cupredoxin-like copper-binding protein
VARVRRNVRPAHERVKPHRTAFRSARHRLRAVPPRLPRAPVAIGVRAVILAALFAIGCDAGVASPTPPIVPGASGAPREVNLIAKDYSFLPDTLDLVPGETVLLHVINGGLEVHEAILGDAAVQDAWEAAEAAVAGGPPGPTPVVTVPAGVAGVRIVVRSGERVDLVWTVPAGAVATTWTIGCHIPGHLARGMQIPIRWVSAQAR